MTTLLILSILLLIAGAVVARGLWRSLHAVSSELGQKEFEFAVLRCSPKDVYRPMTRLLAQDDSAFVQRQSELTSDTRKRWRKARRKALWLYLGEMQADFQKIHWLCAQMAKRSLDPAFATRITVEAARFHSRLVIVRFRCAVHGFLPVPVDISNLVGALDRLRDMVRTPVVRWTEPAPHRWPVA